MSSPNVVVLAARAGASLMSLMLTGLRRHGAERPPRAASWATPSWVVGPEARWVRPPGGSTMDLARRGSLRRVLDALVTRRLEAPGVAWSPSALLEAGWPGDRVGHESGMMRVYSVIRRLRGLGLGAVLLTRDDGYLLDPQVAVVRAAAL